MTDKPSRDTAADQTATFVDRVDVPPAELDLWPSFIVHKEAIDGEVERLSGLPAPKDGRRRSLIVHPRSREPGLGLAPGIQVILEVLLPGERTRPIRHNSSQVVFCIQGRGRAIVDRTARDFERYDAWNTPSMATYAHANTGDEVQVRLLYSNAALLEKMNVHYVDPDPGESMLSSLNGDEESAATPFEHTFPMGDEGAYLMSYERLINPPTQASPALMWHWREVKAELDRLHALGPEYRGRRLYLLYNPATGRTNGTTHNFFATLCLRPAGIVDRPHRHTAAAVNYYFSGSGHSVVGGKVYQWKAGDLMLSAPGWEVHNHVSHDADVYELTIQDSPLNLAMDSLLWQEDMSRPPVLIGSHSGFSTNRGDLAS